MRARAIPTPPRSRTASSTSRAFTPPRAFISPKAPPKATPTIPLRPSTTINGGFESGDLSGWFASKNVFAELLAFGPPLGNYDALLSGSGSLEQDVATTPGQHYQLSFYVAGDADASTDSFTAYWDGV